MNGFLAAALDYPMASRPTTARAPMPSALVKPRPRQVASARLSKRFEERMPLLISKVEGSIAARVSDAIRSVDTVQDGSCLTKGRLAPEQQLLHVEEHSRRVTEQREALLSQLEQSLALQHAHVPSGDMDDVVVSPDRDRRESRGEQLVLTGLSPSVPSSMSAKERQHEHDSGVG